MITRTDVLMRWFRQWANLRAWKRDLSEVKVEVSDRWYPDRLGTCWTLEQRIAVYRSSERSFNAANELHTLLHELAHAATILEHHGPKWQECYSAAILEVTRIAIPRAASSYRILNTAGRAAMKSWWTSSGNDSLLRVTGVAL